MTQTRGHGRAETSARRSRLAKEIRAVNAHRKNKERARRRARMLRKIEEGSLPYTPEIMSWLSRELEKPASKITQEDIEKIKR